VTDTGAGIDAELIPTLFAKDHRLSGEATRAAPGRTMPVSMAERAHAMIAE